MSPRVARKIDADSVCVVWQEVSKAAVSALINLSESPKALGQMLKKNAVGRLMDGLKVRQPMQSPRDAVSRRRMTRFVFLSWRYRKVNAAISD